MDARVSRSSLYIQHGAVALGADIDQHSFYFLFNLLATNSRFLTLYTVQSVVDLHCCVQDNKNLFLVGSNGELDQNHHNRHHHNLQTEYSAWPWNKTPPPQNQDPPRSRNSFLGPIQTLHYGLCPLTTGGNRSYGQNLFQGHRTNVKLGTMHHRGLGMLRKGTGVEYGLLRRRLTSKLVKFSLFSKTT